MCEVEVGWTCDLANPSKCHVPCGDGILVLITEQCDDGNTVSGDGCSANCKREVGFYCEGTVCVTKCGDGFLKGKEECEPDLFVP